MRRRGRKRDGEAREVKSHRKICGKRPSFWVRRRIENGKILISLFFIFFVSSLSFSDSLALSLFLYYLFFLFFLFSLCFSCFVSSFFLFFFSVSLVLFLLLLTSLLLLLYPFPSFSLLFLFLFTSLLCFSSIIITFLAFFLSLPLSFSTRLFSVCFVSFLSISLFLGFLSLLPFHL